MGCIFYQFYLKINLFLLFIILIQNNNNLYKKKLPQTAILYCFGPEFGALFHLQLVFSLSHIKQPTLYISFSILKCYNNCPFRRLGCKLKKIKKKTLI